MKKFYLFFCLLPLLSANLTIAQTQQTQQIVSEIFSKTEYKNATLFLLNEFKNEPFLKDEMVADIAPYLDKLLIEYRADEEHESLILNGEVIHDKYTHNTDSVSVCEKTAHIEYSQNFSDHFTFILDGQTLHITNYRWDNKITYFLYKINLNEGKNEVFYIDISFHSDNTQIWITGQKINIFYHNAHPKLKNELLDNDIQGRMLVTNISNSDSIFYTIENVTNWQNLPNYVLLDKAKDITVKNYYKGCIDSVTFLKDSALTLPRIHDTVYILVHDTLYLTSDIGNENNAIQLNIYPNPTASFVTVSSERTFSYFLTNTAGKILRKEDNAESYMIDLSEYADGIYFLHTSDNVTHKIIKE